MYIAISPSKASEEMQCTDPLLTKEVMSFIELGSAPASTLRAGVISWGKEGKRGGARMPTARKTHLYGDVNAHIVLSWL
jgi:hypothetical protein